MGVGQGICSMWCASEARQGHGMTVNRRQAVCRVRTAARPMSVVSCVAIESRVGGSRPSYPFGQREQVSTLPRHLMHGYPPPPCISYALV